MAIVMRASDTKLQREVAIKELAASGVKRQNFVREARAVAAIQNDHVVTIHSVEDQGVVPYLVMEFAMSCSVSRSLSWIDSKRAVTLTVYGGEVRWRGTVASYGGELR